MKLTLKVYELKEALSKPQVFDEMDVQGTLGARKNAATRLDGLVSHIDALPGDSLGEWTLAQYKEAMEDILNKCRGCGDELESIMDDDQAQAYGTECGPIGTKEFNISFQ